MANEKLNPNGIASQGSWTGVLGDIDEAVASADGSTMDNVVDADDLLLDLTPSAVVDADTVTEITITVRAKKTGTNTDSLNIALVIGGVAQTAINTPSLTTSFVNNQLTDISWDVDRSESDMDGAQVRVRTRTSGMPHDPAIQFDCLDVDVVYTLDGGGGGIPVPVAFMHLAMGHH